jgi:hypothetical protein
MPLPKTHQSLDESAIGMTILVAVVTRIYLPLVVSEATIDAGWKYKLITR